MIDVPVDTGFDWDDAAGAFEYDLYLRTGASYRPEFDRHKITDSANSVRAIHIADEVIRRTRLQRETKKTPGKTKS